MPAKNKKQQNFFILVKAYKDGGEINLKRQYKFLDGSKSKLTPEYMAKIIKTASTIKDADLIDFTSGIEGDAILGDKRDLKAGFWARFRGKYRTTKGEPREGEFIGYITRVDNSKGVVNFSHNGFRNMYGQTTEMPKRENVSSLEFQFLDYALFDNVIQTGKTWQEVVAKKPELYEQIKKIIWSVLES
jgi:hypothetical protein